MAPHATVVDLKAALLEVLEEREALSDEQHRRDHEFLREIQPFLKEWLVAQQNRQRRYEALVNSVVGGCVVGFLSWVAIKALDVALRGWHG